MHTVGIESAIRRPFSPFRTRKQLCSLEEMETASLPNDIGRHVQEEWRRPDHAYQLLLDDPWWT